MAGAAAMASVLVPSDITLLERKYEFKNRTLPMMHIGYSKIDKHDMRRILKTKYDPNSSDPAVHLCIARQNSVSRKVCAQPFGWWGAMIGAGLPWWSFRRYNY